MQPIPRIAAFVSAGVIACAATMAHANLVLNGDFADPAPAGLASWTPASNGSSVAAARDADYIGCCGASGASPNGTFATFGVGTPTHGASLSQTLSTLIGAQYTLTFDFGSFDGNASKLAVDITGQAQFEVDSGPGSPNLSLLFSSFSHAFIATAASTTLTFTDVSVTDGSSTDAFLTSVRVVPEPASLALLGMGLVAIGFARRRREARHLGTLSAN